MTFADAQQFLLSLCAIPRKEYMKEAAQCKVYLDRVQFFLDILGNPEQRIPHYVHVTGTSGKGSVTSMIHAILTKAGYKTGLLQSPHPTHILERWTVGNRHMSKKEFVEIIEELKPALDTYQRTTPYDMVSHAEMMTIIGLVFFAKQKVDWCVLEAACGGRYDSTNIIPHKDIAIVTNVGLDHVKTLGATKSIIAYEKAGIFAKNSLAYTGEKNGRIRSVLKKEANKNNIELTVVRPSYDILSHTLDGITFQYNEVTYRMPLLGAHQAENAILAMESLSSLKIPQRTMAAALRSFVLPIRMERRASAPTIIVDSAHNADKIASTVQTLRALHPTGNLHLVLGFCHDKNLSHITKALAALSPKSVACTKNSVHPFRKVHPPQDIANTWRNLSKKSSVESFLDAHDALLWSKKQAKKGDIILITGSIFLAGELRPSI